jgi:hypothetical protein
MADKRCGCKKIEKKQAVYCRISTKLVAFLDILTK